MHGIIKRSKNEIGEFDPKKTREKISVLQAAIRHAKDMEKWEAGRQAAKWMADEQRNFVGWWRTTVTPGNANIKRVTGPRPVSAEAAEKQTGISKQQVSRWDKEIKRPGYAERIFKPSHDAAMADITIRGTGGTGENEWFTPKQYLKLARDVLGAIDLDPASSNDAQKIVKATEYFTANDSGLEKEWHGRVWLNPPYAQPLISEFVSKIVKEIRANRVSAAIMLTHNYTDTAWFHEAVSASSAICFTRGRVQFYKADGEIAAPTQGQAFFYFGKYTARFYRLFSDTGFLVKP